jgi:hypothetical protein
LDIVICVQARRAERGSNDYILRRNEEMEGMNVEDAKAKAAMLFGLS